MSQRELLVIKVSLSGNNYDYIKIHDNDEPEDLAKIFSLKHKLSQENTSKLERIIEKHIDLLVERDINMMREIINSKRSATPGTPLNQIVANKLKEKIVKSQVCITDKQFDLLKQQKTEERYLMIFNMLNPGRDGKISFGTISQLDLTLPIFNAIMPVLSEIHQKKKI